LLVIKKKWEILSNTLRDPKSEYLYFADGEIT